MIKKLLALIAFICFASACGHDHDMTAIEKQIEEEVNAYLTTNTHVEVDCPSSVKWKEGEEFECEADAGFGDRAVIIVTMGDDRYDNVRWRGDGW